MLGRGVNSTHGDRPPSSVWGDILPRLDALDGVWVNLECCLSTRGAPRPGRTYHFRADPNWAVPALTRGGISGVCLANNHVLDYGLPAFEDTLARLGDANIASAGAGMTRAAATEPAIIHVADLTVGVIAFTDRGPAFAASSNTPGTAFVPLRRFGFPTRWTIRRAINQAREANPDLLIASLHWGPNWVTTPAPQYRTVAHWLVDEGVDLVHGHSAHVIQGVEVYRGRPILHDTGDFVDDYAVKPGLHNDRSFLFELGLTDGTLHQVRLRPIEITNHRVTHASDAAGAWLRSRMRALSQPFGTTFTRADTGLVLSLPSC